MTESPERITVAEQAEAAGRIPSPTTFDPLDGLNQTILRFIRDLPGDHNSMQFRHAEMKVEELFFWLRAHQAAMARTK
jgi:hypothetical protein